MVYGVYIGNKKWGGWDMIIPLKVSIVSLKHILIKWKKVIRNAFKHARGGGGGNLIYYLAHLYIYKYSLYEGYKFILKCH